MKLDIIMLVIGATVCAGIGLWVWNAGSECADKGGQLVRGAWGGFVCAVPK